MFRTCKKKTTKLTNRSDQKFIFILCLMVIHGCNKLPLEFFQTSTPTIPHIDREFRATWVATVANIDWPSQPGLDSIEQRKEAKAIIDSAYSLGLNTIILQIRPQCDAIYANSIEPWSYFLSGQQGKPPTPLYDPLQFWIKHTHARGMELHAWFNPFRAHHGQGGPIREASVINSKKKLTTVKLQKEGYWWLDPGNTENQNHSFAIIMDVLKRYDIDGIHFDDYFYPYPDLNEGHDFPDQESWKTYLAEGGHLTLGDWRRENVNAFIKRIYQSIKKEKSHVKFGISPFGIWRPGFPASIKGLDQYEVLYADARLWLKKGWVDYLAPQLYWPTRQFDQSYPLLLAWWNNQNTKDRHIWPGLFTSGIKNLRDSDEIINQIMFARAMGGLKPGHIHFNITPLKDNRLGIADSLIAGAYKRLALVPATTWIEDKPPASPYVLNRIEDNEITISWSHKQIQDVRKWVIYELRGTSWYHTILPDYITDFTLPLSVENNNFNNILTQIGVSAVDRAGNESEIRQMKIFP